MDENVLVPIERIEQSILLIRGQKVIVDSVLAKLYGVETRVLNQAVRRNIKRFPEDFMFSLTRSEIKNLSQFVIGSSIKHSPNIFVFTEQGVAMLSSVLRSQRAIEVNIQIMRAFVQMRKLIASNRQLAQRLDELERKTNRQDDKIKAIFIAIRQLMEPPIKKSNPIGFKPNDN